VKTTLKKNRLKSVSTNASQTFLEPKKEKRKKKESRALLQNSSASFKHEKTFKLNVNIFKLQIFATKYILPEMLTVKLSKFTKCLRITLATLKFTMLFKI
jgi:hypothetical protein